MDSLNHILQWWEKFRIKYKSAFWIKYDLQCAYCYCRYSNCDVSVNIKNWETNNSEGHRDDEDDNNSDDDDDNNDDYCHVNEDAR